MKNMVLEVIPFFSTNEWAVLKVDESTGTVVVDDGTGKWNYLCGKCKSVLARRVTYPFTLGGAKVGGNILLFCNKCESGNVVHRD